MTTTLHVHNIVRTELTPIRALDIHRPGGRQFHLRDLILIDDQGHRTTVTIFSHVTPDQIAVEAERAEVVEAA
jgi:hypothetical protein